MALFKLIAPTQSLDTAAVTTENEWRLRGSGLELETNFRGV